MGGWSASGTQYFEYLEFSGRIFHDFFTVATDIVICEIFTFNILIEFIVGHFFVVFE